MRLIAIKYLNCLIALIFSGVICKSLRRLWRNVARLLYSLSSLWPQIFEYSLVQKEYTEWSRSLQKKGLHRSWLYRAAPVTHVSFSARNPDYIILHDMNMFCIIDKSLVRVCAAPHDRRESCGAPSSRGFSAHRQRNLTSFPPDAHSHFRRKTLTCATKINCGL